VKLGPNELVGKFDIEVDGGSTTPVNEPQQRQDAQILSTLMAGPLGVLFDPRQMAIRIMEKMGEKNPESMLNSGATVPPETLELVVQNLVSMGVDPATAQQIVEQSLHQALEMADEQAQAADHGEGQDQAQEGPPQAQAA
jgi:hypothetical protein